MLTPHAHSRWLSSLTFSISTGIGSLAPEPPTTKIFFQQEMVSFVVWLRLSRKNRKNRKVRSPRSGWFRWQVCWQRHLFLSGRASRKLSRLSVLGHSCQPPQVLLWESDGQEFSFWRVVILWKRQNCWMWVTPMVEESYVWFHSKIRWNSKTQVTSDGTQ